MHGDHDSDDDEPVDHDAPTIKVPAIKIPDAALAALIGNDPTTEPEAIKRVLAYADGHGLKHGKKVRADAKLAPLLGEKTEVSRGELAKLVVKHLS